jgi:hypothetical protein
VEQEASEVMMNRQKRPIRKDVNLGYNGKRTKEEAHEK